MEKRDDGNIAVGKKSKNLMHCFKGSSSKKASSFWSFLHRKSPFRKEKKVVPGKNINDGKGDSNQNSTSKSVIKLENNNKKPIFVGVHSKFASVGDGAHEEHENDAKLNDHDHDLVPDADKTDSSNMEVKVAANTDSNFQCFKNFDVVTGCSDNHFAACLVNKPSMQWVKGIQNEWKILDENLPDTIFVRVYEDRMDLLRAAIIGPAGTPYHDGLFFFDIHFRSDYPSSPPVVYHISTGFRLNPNLYSSGKVCLSLLNTWSGSKDESWNPKMSTILQVLISIQGLVLNEKPYFNEPGFSKRTSAEKESMLYNKTVFQHSCKLMCFFIKKPPNHFKELVTAHFCKRGPAILAACMAYRKGARIGSVTTDGATYPDTIGKVCPSDIKSELEMLACHLLRESKASF